ncbi:MAG: hypothetical protein COA97_05085 [Flavobacteriales bacterium]|nr:MAG: hypothetical protein COA97_05085 [Flavobacteriales bacterium]
MKIIVFDVGNAACSIIKSPNKFGLMIDCGSHEEKDNPIDILNRNKEWLEIEPYFKSNGDEYALGLLHITHPDDDHVRNAKRIKEEMTPYLLRNTGYEKFPKEEPINQEYIDYLDKKYRGTNPEAVDWGFESNKTFQIPISTVLSEESLNGKIKNNASILRFIEYHGVKILYAGDIETAGWDWLLKNDSSFVSCIEKGVDVLISSHHGHESGYSENLFKIIGEVSLVIHSKGSEANKDGTDVTSKYSEKAKGIRYINNSDEKMYFGKVLTTRSNGNIFLHCANQEFYVRADKSSSNHTKIDEVK